MKGIYLDNSMTARPSQRAVSAMLPYMSDLWGSVSSPHTGGAGIFSTVETNYRIIYDFLGAKEEDTFVLTSSGAEAVNQVFISAHHAITKRMGKNHFVVCATDEAPALMSISRLEEQGCVGDMVMPNEQGLVDPEVLSEMLTPTTALVSLSWGNGLTGVIQPIKEIAQVCKSKGVLLHVDATHILGKVYFDWHDLGIDYLTFNGEQLHAPRGIGGLLARKGVQVHPFIVGGIEQGGLRAGNLNVPALIALSEVSRESEDQRDYMGTEIARLRNKLEDMVVQRCPEAKLFFQMQERLPHVTVIAFPRIVNETMLFLLNRRKVMACIGGGSFQQLALVMEACKVPSSLAHSCVSFSLSRETSDEDIDKAVEAIVEAYNQIKRVFMEEQ